MVRALWDQPRNPTPHASYLGVEDWQFRHAPFPGSTGITGKKAFFRPLEHPAGCRNPLILAGAFREFPQRPSGN
jgi:hypothetical protein